MPVARSVGRVTATALLARLAALAGAAGAGRIAGTTYLIRIAGAGLLYVSHIVLARWLGGHEFGIYVYVWTWLALLGTLANLGLGTAAQRFVPEYRLLARDDLLRGFIHGGRWLAFALGATVALIGLVLGAVLAPLLDQHMLLPLALALICLPLLSLADMQFGIACAHDWMPVAFVPSQIARPLLMLAALAGAVALGMPGTAVTALLALFIALALTTALQTLVLNRRLAPRLGSGPGTHRPRDWFAVALPMALVESFYLLLTFTDIIALEWFHPPQDVAVYFAAAKTLGLVGFVHFAVATAAAHRFAALHVSGASDDLAALLRQTIGWTFWPSLVLTVAMLALGRPILWLFGEGFESGHAIMAVLAVGVMARAALGPVERLLTMSGQQRGCAIVYAAAFSLNATLCLLLIPQIGPIGAALSTATAMIYEALALAALAHRTLGVPLSVWRPSLGRPSVGSA